MPLLSYGITDIGQKRKTNQDAIILDKQRNLFVVADGMGGHNGGDIASALATKEISEYVSQHYEDDPSTLQKKSIIHANNIIKRESEKNEKLSGMGTTVVSMLFKGPNLYLANVGDSRNYLINNQTLYQLSKDHSLVQEKLNLSFLH